MGRKRAELVGDRPAADLARQLRALRDASEMTLRQLADRSGYAPATLSAAESGRRAPTWDVLAAFVQSCGADPERFRPSWERAMGPADPPDTNGRAWNEPPGSDASEPSPGVSESKRGLPLRRLALTAIAAAAALLGGAIAVWSTGGDSPHGQTSPRNDVPLADADTHPLRNSVDIYGCVGTDKPAALDLEDPVKLLQAGWLISHPVPWGAPQCTNQIWWTPFAPAATPGITFVWTFSTGMPQTKTCTLSTYSPPPPSGHAAGTAHYNVEDGTGTSARLVGHVDLDQAAHKGTWVSLGDYRIDSEQVTVSLGNEGTDASANHGAIAGPVHLHCTV